jgi:imidazolonepropionase-like amidohydrolase
MNAQPFRALRWPAGVCASALLALGALPASAQISVGQDGTWLLRGGTVVTVSGGTLANTDVLLRDGRIAQVGPNLSASGATEVDVRGKFVYPGMIDSFTPLGLAEIGGIATMNLRSELGEFNPHDRAVVAVNVESEMISITRSNGVTNVLTAPSGGLISGQAAMLNLSGWTWEDMSVSSSAAFIVNYPSVGGGGGGRGGGFGGRGGGGGGQNAETQVRELKDMLRMAKAYEQARAGGAQQFDIKLEAMRPLMRGETVALVSADNEEQIRGAIALADTFGIRVAVLGGEDAWKVASLLAQKNVPVVLSSIQSTPANDAPYDAIYAQPGVLVRAGVKIAFSTGGASNARHVPYHAALAVAYDLRPEDAIKGLTLWPAEIFGVADDLGSIEVGKMANVFVTDGDPLDVRTNVLDVYIEGRRVSIDDRHTQLYQKYISRGRN